MSKNPVVHFEMPYSDSDRVTKFYTDVFGWGMDKLSGEMGNYVMARTAETDENRMIKQPGMINGGFYPKAANAPEHPSVVISVEDIRDAMEKVTAAGGSVSDEPMEIPGIGQYVSFTDSEGNRVGMLRPAQQM